MPQNSNYGEHIKKYMEEITTEDFDPVSKQEEHEVLNDDTLSKQEKIDFLMKHNIRLVSKVAMKYTNIAEYDDMMQEGCIGLAKAAEKFDMTKDTKFCTYAYFWVFKAIQEYLKKENRDFSTIRNHSGLSLNYQASEDEQQGSNNSLEKTISESSYTPPSGGYFEINKNETTNLSNELSKIVLENDVLDDREKHIVLSRFFSDKKRTLKDIGDEIGLSHSMVKLVQDKALQKIKDFVVSEGISREDFEFTV